MRMLSLALVVTLGLAACSSGDTAQETSEVAANASAETGSSAAQTDATATATADSKGAKGTAWDYKQKNDLYEFEYQSPAVAPKLAAILKKEAESAEAQLKADTQQARAEAKDSDFPYRPL